MNGFDLKEEAVKEPQLLKTSLKPTEVFFSTLPYIQGTSERIAKTLNQFNVNVGHKPVMTVGSIQKKTKNKLSKELSTGVIYEINC